MKLIYGLGNIGKKYQFTRHNAGWIFLDLLLEKYGYINVKEEFDATIYFSKINQEKVLFVKPNLYMNNSGIPLQRILAYYRINLKDLIILQDEKDFEVGKTQIRLQGSAGGHNGIKSVIQYLNTQNFTRFRIGIGKHKPGWKIVDWVLSNFENQELVQLQEDFQEKASFLNDWTSGMTIENIMNKYNKN